MSYDREADILVIETTDEGIIDHAEHTGSLIAHFSQEGQIVLLEILDASEFLAALIKASLRNQGQALPLAV
ncbi:MAG: DUF2283 domain-containing protein [Ardenticatenaceae bacterium]|nr:DUF2283 domain-containing protein [Ardenticatenaceae bacterium]